MLIKRNTCARLFVLHGIGLILKLLCHCIDSEVIILWCLCVQAAIVKRFVPLFDRILVERFAPELKTKGGVLLPEKSQGKVLEATVLAVGPGARNDVIAFLLIFARLDFVVCDQ